MDIFTKLLYLFADLILPLAVGYLCRCRAWFDQDISRRLVRTNIWGFVPVLAILTLWVLPLNYSLIWLPAIGVLLCMIPGIVAYFRVEKKFPDPLDKGSYVLSAILSNTTTLGGLCAYIFYGETGFAAGQMVVMLQNVVMFSFCFPLAAYYYQKSIGGRFDGQSVSAIFITPNQLPVVGTIVGLLLNLSGIARPALAAAAVDPLVHIGAWTALLPIGYSIDIAGMRKYYSELLDLLPVKFIVTPLAAYLLANGLIANGDKAILHTVVLLAAMPTAVNTVIAAQMNQLNVNIAMAAFVLTTAVFVGLGIPLLFLWIM
ncbi:AEC family transporter [Acetonema longum]|uniref:Auxin efflux carrier n=1 Tax=Acetonema longum DSM 6540 TaxID=1009370 RepID=F7NEF3_9FIRM|nr:hypothetical protein [Acetonema longum]EGO65364.1 hypothetical protein ALO_02081 [Acetonema longum DSM 6540]